MNIQVSVLYLSDICCITLPLNPPPLYIMEGERIEGYNINRQDVCHGIYKLLEKKIKT